MRSSSTTILAIVVVSCVLTLGISATSTAQTEEPTSDGVDEFPTPEPVDDPDVLVDLPDVDSDIDDYLHLPAPRPPGRIRQLAVSQSQVCALVYSGVLYCWSLEDGAQLPVAPKSYASITAGSHHFCALDTTSRPICWSEAGDELEAPDEILVDLAAGDGYSCGLRTTQTPICWGERSGALRAPPSGPFHEIDAGGDQTCASGPFERGQCWGPNSQIAAPFEDPVVDLSVSSDTLCGVDGANRPRCHQAPTAPTFDAPVEMAAAIGAGHSFACTLDTTGRLACAGPRAPELPATPPLARMIETSEDSVCAVTAWETVMCWDASGQQL